MEMATLDIVNSIFFFTTSAFVVMNVFKLIQDKEVKGVKLLPSCFFSVSTWWGMYYYYQIEQMGGFLGITLLAIGNTSWMALAIYYEKILNKENCKMGYDTDYQGILKFNKELAASQLGILNEILGADFRDFSKEVQKELVPNANAETPSYINLELTKDFSGIQWDGSEKSYAMVSCVNAVTIWMRHKAPYCEDFAFVGTMHCQGEAMDDRWDLIMEDGIAMEVKTPPSGVKIECPHCEESFYYEG